MLVVPASLVLGLLLPVVVPVLVVVLLVLMLMLLLVPICKVQFPVLVVLLATS